MNKCVTEWNLSGDILPGLKKNDASGRHGLLNKNPGVRHGYLPTSY